MDIDAIPGLLWGYHFDPAGQRVPFDPNDLDAALHARGGWTWLHLNLANARSREWLVRAPLPERVRHLLLDDEELPTVCGLDSVAVGVFADLKRGVGQLTEETAKLRFALTDHLLVTCRRTPLASVEAVHAAVERGEAFVTPYALVDAILGAFARTVNLLGQELSKQLDAIEDRVVLQGATEESESLGKMRRTALRLHRELSAKINLLSTAIAEEERTLPSAFIDVLERGERRMRTLDRDIESMQERARTVQDEMAAKATEVTNRNLYTLSILTALFLPPTLITGIFGMNTDGLPWTDDAPNGFAYALLLCIASACAIYLVVQRIGGKR